MITAYRHFFLLLVVLVTGVSQPLYAQWMKADGPMHTFSCMIQVGDAIIAGTNYQGIFRSTDNGYTWNSIIVESNITAIIQHDGYLFAASSNRSMLRSSDNGFTWEKTDSGLEGTAVLSIYEVGDTLFAGTQLHGVFHSIDNGATWMPANGSGLMEYMDVFQLIMHSGKLYAATGRGLFVTQNGGKLWTTVPGTAEWGVGALAISNGVLIIGTDDEGVFRLNDELNTLISTGLEWGTVYDIVTVGGDVFVATHGGGVFRTSDLGVNWTQLNQGLPETWVSSMALASGSLYVTVGNSGIWKYQLSEVLGIEDMISPGHIPLQTSISANPSSGHISIRYELEQSSVVTITIYDALGGIVSQPVPGIMQDAGEHHIEIQNSNLVAGCYFSSVNVRGVERSVRFMVVR